MTAPWERQAVRLAWGIGLGSLGLVAASSVLLVLDWKAVDSVVTVQLLYFIQAPIVAILGALIAARRPKNPIGWLLLAIATIGAIYLLADFIAMRGLLSGTSRRGWVGLAGVDLQQHWHSRGPPPRLYRAFLSGRASFGRKALAHCGRVNAGGRRNGGRVLDARHHHDSAVTPAAQFAKPRRRTCPCWNNQPQWSRCNRSPLFATAPCPSGGPGSLPPFPGD